MNISKGTIIRTAVLIVALVNQGLTIAGKSPLPFDDAAVAEGVSLLLTTAASLWAWYKNNSFSRAAIAADSIMHDMKKNPETGVDATAKNRIERM